MISKLEVRLAHKGVVGNLNPVKGKVAAGIALGVAGVGATLIGTAASGATIGATLGRDAR